MNHENENNSDESQTDFGLQAPGNFGHDATTRLEVPGPKPSSQPATGGGSGRNDDSTGTGSGGGGWKGFEEEEVHDSERERLARP